MTETIVVDEASAGKLKILAWAVIPVIIFVIGFSVWGVMCTMLCRFIYILFFVAFLF